MLHGHENGHIQASGLRPQELDNLRYGLGRLFVRVYKICSKIDRETRGIYTENVGEDVLGGTSLYRYGYIMSSEIDCI